VAGRSHLETGTLSNRASRAGKLHRGALRDNEALSRFLSQQSSHPGRDEKGAPKIHSGLQQPDSRMPHRERKVRRHSPKAGVAWNTRPDSPSATAFPHLLCHRVYALAFIAQAISAFADGASTLRRGLPESLVQVSIYTSTLKIEYQDTELADLTRWGGLRTTHTSPRWRIRVSSRQATNRHNSALWTLGPDEWLLFLKLPDYAARIKRQRKPEILQLPLPDDGTTTPAVAGACARFVRKSP
jgi:hypothetical protein